MTNKLSKADVTSIIKRAYPNAQLSYSGNRKIMYVYYITPAELKSIWYKLEAGSYDFSIRA